jgi:hypothetical protein
MAAHRGRLTLALGGGAIDALEREVSASPGEFARSLRNAFPDALEDGPMRFRVERDGVRLEIALRPGPDLAIALLRLPTVRVSIRCLGADATARARVLAYLDLATHRGGG